jgi:hypothetical protein
LYFATQDGRRAAQAHVQGIGIEDRTVVPATGRPRGAGMRDGALSPPVEACPRLTKHQAAERSVLGVASIASTFAQQF